MISIRSEHFQTVSEGRTGKLSVRNFGDDVAGRMRGLLRFHPFQPSDPTSQLMAQALDEYLENLYDAPSTNPYGTLPLQELIDKANDAVMFKTPTAGGSALSQSVNSDGGRVTRLYSSITGLAANMFVSASPRASRWGGRKPLMRVKRVTGPVVVFRPYHVFASGTPINRATELFFRADRDRPRPEVILSNTERNAPLVIPWVEYLE